MKKIQTDLENAIRKNPDKSYKVLIVIKDRASDLKIENAKKLMENILSAELKGSRILSIAENKSVESIELDSEMTIN